MFWIVPIVALGVGAIAIICGTYIKVKKIEQEKKTDLSLPEIEELVNMKDSIIRLEQENINLKSRITNLETISANPEFTGNELPPASDEMKVKIKAQEKLKSE